MTSACSGRCCSRTVCKDYESLHALGSLTDKEEVEKGFNRPNMGISYSCKHEDGEVLPVVLDRGSLARGPYRLEFVEPLDGSHYWQVARWMCGDDEGVFCAYMADDIVSFVEHLDRYGFFYEDRHYTFYLQRTNWCLAEIKKARSGACAVMSLRHGKRRELICGCEDGKEESGDVCQSCSCFVHPGLRSPVFYTEEKSDGDDYL